jgi:hypothetical protein
LRFVGHGLPNLVCNCLCTIRFGVINNIVIVWVLQQLAFLVLRQLLVLSNTAIRLKRTKNNLKNQQSRKNTTVKTKRINKPYKQHTPRG